MMWFSLQPRAASTGATMEQDARAEAQAAPRGRASIRGMDFSPCVSVKRCCNRHGPVRRVGWLKQWTAVACLAAVVAFWPTTATAQRFATNPYSGPAGTSPTAGVLREVGLEQHLDALLPLDATFRDEAGQEVKLGQFFNGKPVVLALVYYRCPMLCTQVLTGFLRSSQAIPLEIGRDYEVVTVSFDPEETPELAAAKKASYVKAYRRPGAATGWHFLTGDKASIQRLTETVGFRYHYDVRSGQFAHASGIVMATPEGRLSRYLYGIEYAPADLRLGLVESSAGRIGSPVDQVLLLCYHYDPLTGKYGLAISGLLKAAGTLTVLLMGAYLVSMYRREWRRPRLTREPARTTAGAELP